MKFLVFEMGVPLEHIAKRAASLGYSLKQRNIPRCSIVKILKSKSLIDIISIISINEKKFLEKFVIRFQESSTIEHL